MNLSDVLQDMALGEKEASIYKASLELGSSTATLIAKKAGVQRTHFYGLVEKLIALNLIQKTMRGKKLLFSAADPDTLITLQEQKLARLKDALPEFKALYNTVGQKPKILFFEGRAGIDQLNEDTLRYKGEVVGFTTPRFATSRGRSTGDAYIQKRVALGKHARVIGENVPNLQLLQKHDESALRETRLLSPEVFRSEVEIVMYGAKVAIIDYKEEWGFIIEGSEITKALKMIFEIVWAQWER